MYYCKSCGEEESFQQERDYEARGTDILSVNADGYNNEILESAQDWKEYDYPTETYCGSCGDVVDWYDSDIELVEAMIESGNEVPEVYRYLEDIFDRRNQVNNWRNELENDEG